MAQGDSQVSICNAALQEIGLDPIAALTEESKAAIHARLRYDQARRTVLRQHVWNFAKRQASLPASATSPLFTYANAFSLPADYLRVVELPENEREPYEIMGKHLCTNAGAPLRLIYIANVTDPTLFDPLFVEVLSCHIAAALAVPMLQDRGLQRTMLAKVADLLPSARSASAQENSTYEVDVDVLLGSRR